MATMATENPPVLPDVLLDEVREGLKAGALAPYIGPGISALAAPAVPMTPEALAAFFETKTTLPKRARGNAWAAAQYIESRRFRDTVTLWMNEAFATPVAPGVFHHWLAGLPLRLIVDSWYSGEMRTALAARGTDWAQVQGITRSGIGESRWFRFYDASGAASDEARAGAAKTLLYSPHGGVSPGANYLISDADYVEVLTDIDIQTPIPEEVRQRRTGLGFVFIGCRFHDQLLRTYARQIIKRSSDRHYAIVDLAALTRNERRFLDEQGLVAIDMPLQQALSRLIA